MARRFQLTLTLDVDDEEGLVEFARRRCKALGEPEIENGLDAKTALQYLLSISDIATFIENFGTIDAISCDRELRLLADQAAQRRSIYIDNNVFLNTAIRSLHRPWKL